MIAMFSKIKASPIVVRLLAAILAFALSAIPLIGTGLWWLHQASEVHAARVAVNEHRLTRIEVALDKLDDIQKDVSAIRESLGAEKARRETLHPAGR